MKRNSHVITLAEVKRKCVPILKRAGVTRAAVFGSVARGEATAESDVDLLVDLPMNMSLFDLVGLQQNLAKRVGRDVDVVSRKFLHPLIRRKAMRDSISLYESRK